MKVKYKVQDIRRHKENGLLINEERYYNRWPILPEQFPLTYDKSYNVYGIDYSKEGFVNFLVEDDTGVIYPKFYPSDFFEIEDNRLSKFWVLDGDLIFPLSKIEYPVLISFKEMIENEYFFDEILDCKNNTCQIFKQYKELMDLEFANNSYPKSKSIGDNWFLCYKCDSAIEDCSNLEIIRCSNCQALQNKNE